MKRYYTTSKTGEEVEVDYDLAKQLIASGKKQPSDFSIEEDNQSPQKPTYKEQAPSLLQRVNEVGYSGLSDDDKQLYNAQFPHSDWAKADPKRTLQDAQRLTDEAVRRRKIAEGPAIESALPGEFSSSVSPSDLFGGVRTAMSVPVGIGTGIFQTALEKLFGYEHKQDPNTGIAQPQEAPSVFENIGEGMRKGRENEGFSGLVADPLNLTMAVPGLGEAVMGSRVSVPTWGQAAIRAGLGAAEGAGYGAGSILLDPTKKDESIGSAAGYGAGLGALIGGASGLLKRYAIDNFPGVEKIERGKMAGKKNTEMLDLSESERAKIYGMLPILPTREGYYATGQKLTTSTKDAYSKVDKEFDEALEEFGHPIGGIKVEDLKQIIKDKMVEKSKAGKGNILQNLVTDKQIDDYIADRFGPIQTTASRTPRKSLESDKDELDIIPISNIGNILGHLNTDIGRLMSKTPTADNKMALVAKDAIVSDVLGNKGTVNDLEDLIYQLKSGSIAHDGKVKSYNDRLEEIAPGTRQNYSLGKRLLGTIAQQTETGPSVRLGVPGLGEIGPHTYLRVKSNYVAPGLAWKVGQILSKPIAAPTIEISGSALDALKRKPDDKKKK